MEPKLPNGQGPEHTSQACVGEPSKHKTAWFHARTKTPKTEWPKWQVLLTDRPGDMEIQRLCKKLHFDAQDVSITDLFLQVQQEIGQLQNWRQAMSQIGYKIQVDPQRSGMPSPAYWRPMVKFSLAMKIPLRPSQTTGMQQDTEHNSHCLNNSPWWPWCRISFSHFTVTMQASAQLWLIWRRLSNTVMALQDRTSGPAQNFELYPCHYGKMGNIRPNA